MNRYSTIVQWSDEDQLFLVTIPEFAALSCPVPTVKPAKKPSDMAKKFSKCI